MLASRVFAQVSKCGWWPCTGEIPQGLLFQVFSVELEGASDHADSLD